MSRRLWIWVGMLLCIYVIVGFWTATAPVKKLDTPGSTYAAGPHGSMAVERLWKRLVLSWGTWEQVPGFLPQQSQSVFVSVQPSASEYNAKDMKDLLNYVATGHTVVWVDNQNDALLKDLHLDVVSMDSTKVETVQTRSSSTSVTAWKNLQFTAINQLAGSGLQQAKVTYQTPDGKVLGAQFRRGSGTLIVWSAASVWENGVIGNRDNFSIPWHFIGNHGVLWDEYGHGYEQQSTLGWMFHGPAVYALIMGIIGLLFYLYKNLWRFGPVRNPAEERPMLGTDYMDALAWHLRRRRFHEAQFKHVVEVTQLRLARHSTYRKGITAQTADDRIQGMATPELRQTWEAWKRIAEQGYRPQQWRKFLKLTRTLFIQFDVLHHDESNVHQN